MASLAIAASVRPHPPRQAHPPLSFTRGKPKVAPTANGCLELTASWMNAAGPAIRTFAAYAGCQGLAADWPGAIRRHARCPGQKGRLQLTPLHPAAPIALTAPEASLLKACKELGCRSLHLLDAARHGFPSRRSRQLKSPAAQTSASTAPGSGKRVNACALGRA